MRDSTKILKRHPNNPLIKVDSLPGIMTVFNPSPAMYKGKTVLLLSMMPFKQQYGGITKVAMSDDGINFKIEDEPFFSLQDKGFPFTEVCKHIIDNRVTQIDDTYYILTPVGTSKFSGPCTVLGKTKDFKNYEVMDIITLPQNRGASLFPEKINGNYFKLDRPGAGTNSTGVIWLSSSPDLIHWGRYRPLLSSGYSSWNGQKIGPTPPIKTTEGWLVIIHGVSCPCDGPHYHIGAVLLDLDNPEKIIGKTYSYLLTPEASYETIGHCDNVVFPCGALADEAKDELRLYYGAADTCIGLATGSLSEVIQACIDEI